MEEPAMEVEDSSSEEYLSAEEGLEEDGGSHLDNGDGEKFAGAVGQESSLETKEEETSQAPSPISIAQDPCPTPVNQEGDVVQSTAPTAHNSVPLEEQERSSPVHEEEEVDGHPSVATGPTRSTDTGVETGGKQMIETTAPVFSEASPQSSDVPHPPSSPPTHPSSPTLPPSPTPVPPPRRKRKKKYDKGSLENLAEMEDKQPLQRRSYTICGANPRKDLESSLPTSISSPDSDNTPEREVVNREDREGGVTGDSDKGVAERGVVRDDLSSETVQAIQSTGQVNHHQQPHLLHTHVTGQDRSRSATPTPAISIQPDHYEWTSGVLSGTQSEIVTSDTSLAKARGSTTSTHSVLFASDDDSLDGGEEREGEEEDGGEEREGEEEEVREGDNQEVTEEREGSIQTHGSVGAGLPHEEEEGQGGGACHVTQRQESPVDDDKEILMSTMVKNLDTGEVIPLSAAQERIPQGHDPLSEHLLRRIEAEGNVPYEDDDASQRRRHRKTGGFRKLKWGRKKERMADDVATPYQDEGTGEDHSTVKYKQSHRQQGKAEFEQVRLKQELKQDLTGIGMGAIWTMEFSICGRLLATAGQDGIVRVWVLTTASHFFRELQSQYQRLGVHSSVDSLSERASVASGSSRSSEEDELGKHLPFMEQPLCLYSGHISDVLDLSWSKNFFLLSGSKDKTVRLWHISRKECLCCFQHIDIVTAIAFHPRDDRYFLSGSLDGKLRLWNIPEKRVALWNEIEGIGSRLITAANFCMNGKLAVVGTYDGRCIFYDTEHLKYHTQIHVKSRHGKNKGRKISGVEPLPGEDKLLVTSNDSRVRLYNLKEHELSCKYKGYLNSNSQIKATFSRDGQYIISGSEDNFIYIWKTHMDLNKLSSTRRDRNEFYESFSAHSASVITAVFAPVPGITVDEGIREVGEMVVAADYKGYIKVYVSGEQL